ncbi:hypothetical protein FOFC_03557 [Fusarium oxysporum]|nr:hypothetical protein FOFC_03557 [Fusarium oxysporum]
MRDQLRAVIQARGFGIISLSGIRLQRGHDRGKGPIKMSATKGTFSHTYFCV